MKSAMRRARAGFVEPGKPLLPFRRQVGGMGAIARKQVAHHAGGLVHDVHDPRVPIHARPEKALDGAIGLRHRGREADDRRWRLPHVVGRLRRQRGEPAAGFGDDIFDQQADQPADKFVDEAIDRRAPDRRRGSRR